VDVLALRNPELRQILAGLYDTLRLDPALSPALQRAASPAFNTGRQVFITLND
jgi:hypothetical protein